MKIFCGPQKFVDPWPHVKMGMSEGSQVLCFTSTKFIHVLGFLRSP